MIDREGWGSENLKEYGQPVQVGESARILSIHKATGLNQEIPPMPEGMGTGCMPYSPMTGWIPFCADEPIKIAKEKDLFREIE